ncbi:Hypothetical predicted protein [Lecanosticta acicola]|uniref:Uncharacterized protein n=1 Tax=Lecanosticta acicola TaxID=111012 RepID=A0AAI9EDW2_9PEZI|nr:Hypothetical predicted protein [Lecanosticta acicola]
MAAWSHNNFLNEVRIQHPQGSTVFTNNDTHKSGALSVATSTKSCEHCSNTPKASTFILSPSKKSSVTITGMGWEQSDIGYACRIEKQTQPSVGPLSVSLWKLYYEGNDHYFEATHGNQPLTITLMIADTTGTPICPVSDIFKIEDGIFGKIARFDHFTRNPDVPVYEAEDRVSVDFDYPRRDPERQYRSDAEDPITISTGRKHKLIFSFPTVSKEVEHDVVAVHSIMPFKKMPKPALSHPYDGPGMAPRFDVVRMSSSSFSTITEDGCIHSSERIWHNHRSTTVWIPNPMLDEAGIFVVLVTLTNGAHAFSKDVGREEDFPFARARMEIVGAREGVPVGEMAGLVW